MNKLLVIILLLLPLGVFSQTYLNKLDSKTDFDKLAGLPLTEKYGQVSAIKLIYDVETKKIYFTNSWYYRYHYEFCKQILGDNTELEYFNQMNYSDDSKRKYLLANINFYNSLNIYALEITPVDRMSLQSIESLWKLISQTTYIGDQLQLLLNSARLYDWKSDLMGEIPLLEPTRIYSHLNYQAISKNKSCGVLHIINDLKGEKNNISPNDIVIINETPLFLPSVAGIVVSEFQTPLSHLSILGQNRKIPIAAYKPAFSDSLILKMNQKNVCLSVFADTFRIDEIENLLTENLSYRRIKIRSDLLVDSLIDIEYINRKSVRYAGNKAANFAILYQLSHKNDFKVPENAFVIPFYFYNQHLKRSFAQQFIDSLLANRDKLDNESKEQILQNIRNEIKLKPIDSTLLLSINQKLSRDSTFKSYRFRSSTNAEDAKGFSGAGLYTSKTGIVDNDDVSIEKAVKKVWASLWSYDAFMERELYKINHKEVYMGILVHRSFPSEEVNGVVITKDLYRKDSYGFVVNAQIGDASVVKPKQGNICDQFICYPDNSDNLYQGKKAVDIITLSNLNDNKLVMTSDEIQNLANQLEIIKKYFISHTYTTKSYIDFGLDVEFKLDGNDRKLYIKQVRLYND